MPGVVGVRVLAVISALHLASGPGTAAIHRRTQTQTAGHSSITLRKRLHVNTLISEPGTGEIDWSSLYSFSSSNFAMPSAVRYTPKGSNVIWGRTEYGVAFDSLDYVGLGGLRMTQFSQSLALAATSVLFDGEKLDIAVAPQALFFLRDESGARLGATAIVRFDRGRNSLGTTLSWSAATHSSPSNPVGTVDAGFGFGRRLSGSPFLEKLTPHINAVWEKSTGVQAVSSLYEGIEYQMTDRISFDLSAQHLVVTGGVPDHQLVFGITLCLGRTH